MANYLYDPGQIDANCEKFALHGAVAHSANIGTLASDRLNPSDKRALARAAE
jgi:hypothetical protein